MGNSKYLDGLTADEYKALSKKLWGIQNHKCFICGKDIDLDIQNTNIDHIRPLVNGGKDDPINFGLTHEHCNKSKQDADLDIAKQLFQLNVIIKEASQQYLGAQEDAHKVMSILQVICDENNAQPSQTVSVADELKKFKELLDMGAISQDEFDAQKVRLLK